MSRTEIIHGIMSETILKYDDYDNLVYKKDIDGTEYHWEYKYNERGDVIYEKSPDGTECHYEYKYDSRGNKKISKVSYNYNK